MGRRNKNGETLQEWELNENNKHKYLMVLYNNGY
jgi:hypothetical protein